MQRFEFTNDTVESCEQECADLAIVLYPSTPGQKLGARMNTPVLRANTLRAVNEYPILWTGAAMNDIEEDAIRWIRGKSRVGTLFHWQFHFVDINCITQPGLLEIVTVAMYKRVLEDMDVMADWFLAEMGILASQFRHAYPLSINDMSWHWRFLTVSVLQCTFAIISQKRHDPERLRLLVAIRKLMCQFGAGGFEYKPLE